MIDGAAAEPHWPRWRRWTFYVLAGLYALNLALPPNSLLPFAVLGWALGEEAGVTSHRVHDISFGVIFVIALLGILAQFRNTHRKVLPMQQATVSILTLVLIEMLVARFDPSLIPLYLVFGLPPILLVLLHPARREVVKPSWRPARVLLAMAIIFAVPALYFAVRQIQIGLDALALGQPVFERLEQLPPETTEEEFEQAFDETIAELGLDEEDRVYVEHGGHWTAMASWAIGLVVLALLVGGRVTGFRLTGWSVGLAVAYYGLVSVATPDDASSAGIGLGLAAIVWGLLFVVVTELERRSVARELVAQAT